MQTDDETHQITVAEEHSLSTPIQELAARLRRSRRLSLGVLLAAAAFFPFALAGLDGDLGTSGFVMLAAELLLGLGTAAYLRRSVERSSSSLEDWKVLDDLLEAQQDTDRATRKVSEAALLHLLPRLTASEAERITPPQRQRLWNLLPRASRALATVVLQALEIIGEPRAIPVVEKLAAGEGIAQSDLTVRTAARTCLERLGKHGDQTSSSLFASGGHHEQSKTASDADLITLVDDLAHEQYTVRKRALQHLQMLDSPALGAALTSIQGRIRNLKRQWRLRLAVTSVVSIGYLLLDELSMLGTPMFHSVHNHIQILGMALVIAAILGWPLTHIQQRIRLAQEVMTQIEDVCVCGPLLELWHTGDPETRRVAEASLVRLLPGLRASDATLLNARQRDRLGQVLSSRSGGLILAVLKALEQIGDKRELYLVERLATGEGLAKHDSRVHQAAQDCLIYLQQRTQGKDANETLLRSSDRDLPAESLLRAAHGTTESQPEQLLRAAPPEP